MVDPEELDRLDRDVADLERNPNVYEWLCETCGATTESFKIPALCCHAPNAGLVFVGRNPRDGDAWGAAGLLLDLVKRQAVQLKAARAEIDAANLRDIQDEHTIAELRSKSGDSYTMHLIAAEVERARAKHPTNAKLLVALMEEVGELAKALLQALPWQEVVSEAVQVACVAVRIIEEGDADFGADKTWSKIP